MSESESAVELRSLHQYINQLPMLPGIVYELMRHDPDSEEFFDVILKLATADPPLSSMILSYANSVAFASGQPHNVTNLKAALSRIGAKRFYQMLFTSSVAKIFLVKDDKQRMLWKHSLEVAHFASYLVEHAKVRHISPYEVYTAALLHDIGRFMLLKVAPNALNRVNQIEWHTGKELIEVEKEMVGHTHTEVGHLAAKQLHLPLSVSLAIHYHHSPGVVESEKLDAAQKQLLRAIIIADHCSFYFDDKPERYDLEPKVLLEEISDHVIPRHLSLQNVPLKHFCLDAKHLSHQVEDTLDFLGVSLVKS
ncbi:MAG: putative signal transduction protein [Idiomarinaceae bacterium HL-53]|nr:MAG: putative signal transduction protein [Idiomarinaceae bacterium HL-53]CUS49175.1 HDIG domain-containing protein [Idiomarinaceae bacterium HL-53]